jgi:hypothetical protein
MCLQLRGGEGAVERTESLSAGGNSGQGPLFAVAGDRDEEEPLGKMAGQGGLVRQMISLPDGLEEALVDRILSHPQQEHSEERGGSLGNCRREEAGEESDGLVGAVVGCRESEEEWARGSGREAPLGSSGGRSGWLSLER